MKLLSLIQAGVTTVSVVLLSAVAALARPAYVVNVQPGNIVNVRSQPTTHSEALTYATLGQKLEIMDGQRGQQGYIWYMVRINPDDRGWIREDFLQFPGVGGEFFPSLAILDAGLPGERLNVRSGPDTRYNALFAGLHGDKVFVNEMTTDRTSQYTWYHVQYLGQSHRQGWVRGDLVQLLF
ncbi:SH3 domain-containing protein [Alkalinema pantanalense CENA528]|uniref:SH3 domain-containing protein n=1 Tax=Alkalinema pantanalense TaxID=1620705 RepID=UPI003D6EA566